MKDLLIFEKRIEGLDMWFYGCGQGRIGAFVFRRGSEEILAPKGFIFD